MRLVLPFGLQNASVISVTNAICVDDVLCQVDGFFSLDAWSGRVLEKSGFV